MKKTSIQKKRELEKVLYLAFELGDKKWVLGFSNGSKERKKTVDALDIKAVLEEVKRAKEKLHLPGNCKVISCYEAGWEGFWLARWLKSVGIENYVLDSAAIEQNRRRKSAKSDGIDVSKLLNLLWRYHAGEKKALHVVRVPSVEEEDERQLHRERKTLVDSRGSYVVRANSLLRGQGVRWNRKMKNLRSELPKIKLWDGSALPEGLKARLLREWERWDVVNKLIKQIEKEQEQHLTEDEAYQAIVQLMLLKSIGMQTAWLLEKEIFGWRKIRNRRQLGALVGLAPTPFSSGGIEREQGISKAGNRRVRTAMIELAWFWLRYQPQSKLSQWYFARFGKGGKRQRRVGIVALARKLIIALWRYREYGVIPEGAELKVQIS